MTLNTFLKNIKFTMHKIRVQPYVIASNMSRTNKISCYYLTKSESNN